MPCHVDPIPAKLGEAETVVEVVNGKIRIREVGDSFKGRYPKMADLVKKARKKFKSFSYRKKGTLIVFVSPCPKGC